MRGHPELRRDALFAPSPVNVRHFRDQSLEFGRDPRATAATGPPPPKQSERLPMADESVGLDDRQHVSPDDESRQPHECDARGVVRATRPDAAFQIARELFSKEEILGACSTAQCRERALIDVCERVVGGFRTIRPVRGRIIYVSACRSRKALIERDRKPSTPSWYRSPSYRCCTARPRHSSRIWGQQPCR
jgi:hypothetical protein